MKLYGSLDNRMEENKMFCDKIEVGTGVTEYSYSDRRAFEVIAVQDQKHCTIREYDATHIGEAYTNEWKLTSNESNSSFDLVKRGNFWYSVITITKEMIKGIEEDIDKRLYLAMNGFSIDTINDKGKQTKYRKMNISFGVADYYYDYEF